MLKDYKRKFILTNLLLVGAVLLAMNALILIYSHHAAVRELESTMAQMLEPFEVFDAQGATPVPRPQDGTDGQPPAKPDGEPPKTPPGGTKTDAGAAGKYDKSISVFFCDNETGAISALSDVRVRDASALYGITEAIGDAEGFGKLGDAGLYYYARQTANDRKIAIADVSFVRGDMLRLGAILLLIFGGAMLLFYFVSRRAASLAVRPLEQSVARERQFIADVSHDLKTPITAMLANADILAGNPQATVGEMQKWIDGTKQAALNMRALVEDMLVLAESENARGLQTEVVDFSAVAARNALFMESVAYERGVAYRMDTAEGIFIRADEAALSRVVASLIANALKYEPAGGEVRISLAAQHGRAFLRVCNRKTLIPPEALPHIFERFYRLDRARGAGGHGLGLAIAKNTVEAMHGSLTAESDAAHGTVFTVTFPLTKEKNAKA